MTQGAADYADLRNELPMTGFSSQLGEPDVGIRAGEGAQPHFGGEFAKRTPGDGTGFIRVRKNEANRV